MLLRATLAAGLLWAGAWSIADAHEPKAAQAAVAQAVAPGARPAVEVVEAFHAALARGDTATALNQLSREVVIYEQGSAERSRAEYAADHLGADAEFARATRREVTSRRAEASGELAMVSSESRTNGRFRDKDVNSVTVETMVLRRSQGRWSIVHVHWSSRKTGG